MLKKFFLFSLIAVPLFLGAQAYKPTNYIVVDQFGYLPESRKIAVIRNPEQGFDAAETFKPGRTYALVDAKSKRHVFKAKPVAWKNSSVDPSSGDIVWHFDFSSVTKEGTYFVLDIERRVRSHEFQISANVYKEILKQAFKTFYYQRAGFPKTAKIAGEGWADGASHLGKLQDPNCRQWGLQNDASTEKDVRGGWYDAGDFNKYTNWTSDYIIYMLLAYEENPKAWTDDFNIPESGNSIPDILDEAIFGLEHLLRLQFSSGSVISIVGLDEASPPSSASKPSYWGSPSTSSTLSAVAAYAYGAKVVKPYNEKLAAKLTEAAKLSWDWAEANPNMKFYNNSAQHGTQGLGAGQQEVDDMGLIEKRLQAALRMYDLTGNEVYKKIFEDNYKKLKMIAWTLVFPFGEYNQDLLLYYAKLPKADPVIVEHIKAVYKQATDTIHNLFAIKNNDDPYLSYQKDYVWGSNGTKAKQGNIYYNLVQYNIMPEMQDEAKKIAEYYIHYLHGVNPLNKCYLTNMSAYGAENSVNQIYHMWFVQGSKKWDEVGKSTYGPPPGFITGGPNKEYDWDKCCPQNCDSKENNAKCFELDVKPLKNQPAQKSYMDFNQGWPLNSWSVGENSNGYQVQYLRLLSKFVK